MHTYVVEYLNENEFNKKTRALKKYNMLAYNVMETCKEWLYPKIVKKE